MNPRQRFTFGITQLAPHPDPTFQSKYLLFLLQNKGNTFGSPLVDGVILWQSYLDTYGDCRMLKPILLAFFMTLSTQVNAQVRKEFVCNKWSQMDDVETVLTFLYDDSKPFVLVSDGNTLSFKNEFNEPIVASRLGRHNGTIDMYSQVSSFGETAIFYYFYKKTNTDKEPYEIIEDPSMVKLRRAGHSIGDLLGTECFKR